MDKPRVYEIHIDKHLSDQWSEWFEGLTIRNTPDGTAVILGMFIDQAELFGLLNKIHSLNIGILSVIRL
jgi:hypothetical protein